MEVTQTYHFTQRLDERFSHKGGKIDRSQYEYITPITPNRYEHPKVQRWLREGRAPKYLVSKKHNIVIPMDGNGRLITALWYNGKPNR